MREFLKTLLEGKPLARAEARAAMDALMDGAPAASQVGAFLAALKVRGETAEELTGFAQSLRSRAVRVAIGREPLVDTCGTGGDGSGSFNISTAAAFIAAGAGAAVAKHGNRSVSSRCGSADVLEALGIKQEVSAATAARCVEEAGLCFLFAPAFHPALKRAAPVRKELGVRTVFNLLGPLVNPAGARRQVLGVYDRKLVGVVAEALKALGSEEAMVVSSADGLDELSLGAPTTVAHLKGGAVLAYEVSADSLGFKRRAVRELAGGDAKANAGLLAAVLDGEMGAARDVSVLNAAAALVVSGVAADLERGVGLAAESIDSGRAKRALERVREITNDRRS